MVRLDARLRPLWPYLKPVYTHTTRLMAPASIAASRIRGGYVPHRAVATLEEAAQEAGGTWSVARPEELVTRDLPRGFPPGLAVFAENRSELMPAVGVAEIPDGRVMAPHAAVVTGQNALVQAVSQYFGTTRPHEHPLYLHPFPPEPHRIAGRLGVLASRGDSNYYHFLMDVLPRVSVLDQCPGIAPVDRWYVPAATPFQRELLTMFGIGPDERIDSTEIPHVQADCLVVPSPPSMEVRNPPWVVGFLRRRLLDASFARVADRAIYVSRGPGRNNRRVLNQDAVVSLLTRRGFVVVDPDALTVAEQIRAFAEASVVVAPHGAALANLVFASAGATVIELFPAGVVVPDYWKLASGIPGLDYRYLVGRGPTKPRSRNQMLVSDIDVDVGMLAAMLEETEWG
jgi:capsular polysaccharide biosynthesis protein